MIVVHLQAGKLGQSTILTNVDKPISSLITGMKKTISKFRQGYVKLS